MIKQPVVNKPLPVGNDVMWVRTIDPIKRRWFLGRLICSHKDTTSFVASVVLGLPPMDIIRHEGGCCVDCGTVLSCYEQDTFPDFMKGFGR